MSEQRFVEAGVRERLDRIFREDGRAVVVPFDDIRISGRGSVANGDPTIVGRISDCGPDAIVGFRGDFLWNPAFTQNPSVGRIANLTLSWSGYQHTHKGRMNTVSEALEAGADAVAVHVNIKSRQMWRIAMFEILHETYAECADQGLPLIPFMYPRGEKLDGSDENFLDLKANDPHQYAKLVCEAVEWGVDAGESVRAIKTHYTGTQESFATVVETAQDVPLLMAGGSYSSPRDALQMAYDACEAGASGTSFGRNVWNSPYPEFMVDALKRIVHDKLTVDQAMEQAGFPEEVILGVGATALRAKLI